MIIYKFIELIYKIFKNEHLPYRIHIDISEMDLISLHADLKTADILRINNRVIDNTLLITITDFLTNSNKDIKIIAINDQSYRLYKQLKMVEYLQYGFIRRIADLWQNKIETLIFKRILSLMQLLEFLWNIAQGSGVVQDININVVGKEASFRKWIKSKLKSKDILDFLELHLLEKQALIYFTSRFNLEEVIFKIFRSKLTNIEKIYKIIDILFQLKPNKPQLIDVSLFRDVKITCNNEIYNRLKSKKDITSNDKIDTISKRDSTSNDKIDITSKIDNGFNIEFIKRHTELFAKMSLIENDKFHFLESKVTLSNPVDDQAFESVMYNIYDLNVDNRRNYKERPFPVINLLIEDEYLKEFLEYCENITMERIYDFEDLVADNIPSDIPEIISRYRMDRIFRRILEGIYFTNVLSEIDDFSILSEETLLFDMSTIHFLLGDKIRYIKDKVVYKYYITWLDFICNRKE